MSSRSTLLLSGEDGTANDEGLLATSAGGATILIGLSFGSRSLTFLVNQILLRYLSPELLGVSTQLEVYSISVLFFARESLRVAIQREPDIKDGSAPKAIESIPKGHVDSRTAAGRTQGIVNLSYLSINLGVIFAVFFAALYYHGVRANDPTILQTPYFGEALKLYALAAIWELLSEPCFVVVQQKGRIKTRAAAEFYGTLLRCLVTCGSAIWASWNGRDLGVLPFALGQGMFALSLSAIYYWGVWEIASAGHFSLFLSPIYSSDSKLYLFCYLSWPLLTLSGSLFMQGILKHFLTQGDTFIISTLASARAQGVYALAANYGGLVARLILQPIEERSRSYFGQLLSSSKGSPSREAIDEARKALQDLLRACVLLSACILAVGPTLAPLLLKLVAGSRWSTSGAGNVLATYCYYIPLLAINGLTEAFVSAVATEADIRWQSMWMLGFSACFASAAFFFLRFLEMGAAGLVWANVLNMVFRIIWSTRFVTSYMKRNGAKPEWRRLLPSWKTIAAAGATVATLRRRRMTSVGDITDTLWVGGIAGILVGVLLYSERQYFLELLERYNSLRNKRAASTMDFPHHRDE